MIVRILNPKLISTMKTLKTLGLAVIAFAVIAAAPISNDSDKNEKHDHVGDIVALAVQTDALSTLVAAVQAAGLVETLQSEGPFTVFAPTNEAFAALPEGTLESLLLEENREMLIQILTYHVVPGKVMSSDLSDGMTAETVQGSAVTINLNNYGVTVDGASVVQADVEASNGVVHVIDAVILPKQETQSSY
jgi:uncharacterized surface protein with fasciclin (FAS1) repeats